LELRFDRKKVGLYLGPLLFIIVLLIPEPQAMIDAAATRGASALSPMIALGMLLWILVWWVTECMPLGLAALAVPLVFCISGILTWDTALTTFTNPIIWIFMAGFVLAAAFRKWELDRRVSARLASMYKGNNPMVAAMFVCCLPVFLLTLTGSITASTSVVFPFLTAYLAMMNLKSDSKYSTACMLALAQAATAGAMLLLISTPPNLIAKGTAVAAGYDLTFFDWIIVGTPHALLGLLISWVVVFKVIKPEMKTLDIDKHRVENARKSFGPLSRGEKVVLGILIVAITLWMLPSMVKVVAEGNPGLVDLSNQLTNIMPEAMPAVLIILAAGLIRVKKEPILKWNEIVQGIDWNVVFLFGGGIALGLGLEASGFAGWLSASVAASIGANASAWVIFVVSCLIGFALSYAASNTAAALISCPIALSLAVGAMVNPIPPIIGAALACSIPTAIPSTTPPMAIVYSSGRVSIWQMMKVGLVSDTLRLLVLIAIGPLLTGLII